MAIAVIDQGAELFWFVSNALLQDEIPLKHLTTIQASEQHILSELPDIVILNGDDKAIEATKFIARIRNHVFARNTLFIVVTSDTSVEFKKELIIAGAGQILYKGRGYTPSPNFLRAVIKWFLKVKAPDPRLIEYKPVPFPEEGEFNTFGRLGWISPTHCYIEVNLDLSAGQNIELHTTLFDELEIKQARLTVVEKNTTGRYYQYTNGYYCKIDSKDSALDQRKIATWIKDNQKISKYKPLKILYYEPTFLQRDNIKKMIKVDQRYCARGYSHIENLAEDLEFHKPQLVLINRLLIQQNKARFEPIKNFIKNNFSFCVTYDLEALTDVEEFKKNYEYAMHMPETIDDTLLSSMIGKLEVKLLSREKEDIQKKVYFNKYSPYSRINLRAHCKVVELAISGVAIELPFVMSPYCAFEVSSAAFTSLHMNRMQFFRSFISKKMSASIYHQCIFIGQTVADNELIKMAIDEIKISGLEKWKNG